MTRRAAALLGALLVAACGSSQEPNDADVAFATSMIEHHAQAIQLANVTIGREGLDPRVADLAEQVRVGQTAELDTMSAWLEEWGEPVPETGFATGDGHTHSEAPPGHDQPGAASREDLDALARTSDARFESRWLAMMIEHHEGALTLTDEVIADGAAEEVARLAERIKADQQAEIDLMEKWADET